MDTEAFTREDIDRKRPSPVGTMDVLWITAGLGCDGDTIAMTAATNPSIEDILMGNIPGIPEVTLHNPVLASGRSQFWYKFRGFQ